MSMLFGNSPYIIFSSEIVILVTSCLILLIGMFINNKFLVNKLTLIFSILGLFISTICSFFLLKNDRLFFINNFFINDKLVQLIKLCVYFFAFIFFLYSWFYIVKHDLNYVSEYYVLSLFSILGMMILVSSYSFLTIYLGLELLSFPIYVMIVIFCIGNNEIEAALKYFFMGAIASGLLLYGISLLYSLTGKLDLISIFKVIKSGNLEQSQMLFMFASILVLSAFSFKLSIAPFHMWAPDVYEGSSIPVTLFISTIPKISILGVLLHFLIPNYYNNIFFQWKFFFLIILLFSIGIGNILAIFQSNIKRFLAYSSISHIGYSILGLLCKVNFSYSAVIYYFIFYSLSVSAFFGFLTVLSVIYNKDIRFFYELKGLNRVDPLLAFFVLTVIFSIAGIPPTIGFFAKFYILKILVENHLFWIAIFSLLFSVIGLFNYIYIIKIIYFDDFNGQFNFVKSFKVVKMVFFIHCLFLIILGIFPSILMDICINILH
ncbi:NADH-quinone oxidoreductase subunit N [Candidatus Legionella polyplacis]|uniref:NADH-quinone oxidoreductase subunit N n=1 Tax=Candidatus Legionella polyplacis TaxID=2005262 RepID=A0ABZ2GZP6_9GAMM